MNQFDMEKKFEMFKDNFYKSKKYWIIYLIIIFLGFGCQIRYGNLSHLSIPIMILILVSFFGIFFIIFHQGHQNYKELYKTAFIIILAMGIITCLLTPILCTPDEVEHFVRSEMTSNGVIIPDYEGGHFFTIQSTLDLIEDTKETSPTGFDRINMFNASVFHIGADTNPINTSLVEYPSAFAQNPFYGYLPQAIGIAVAKLLNLNAVWLVWLGRIFNIFAYASLAAIAIKKTPILKIPMFVMACLPISVYMSSSVSIDAMINGLGLIVISYFFYLYSSPDNSLNNRNFVIFSLLVVLLGLCKVTCFAFILLLFCIPRNKFEDNKYRLKSLVCLIAMGVIAILWTKFYADPGFLQSFRYNHNFVLYHVNSGEQINFMLTHLDRAILVIFNLPFYLKDWNFMYSPAFNIMNLMFLGAVIFMYPTPKFELKSKIGSLITFGLFFVGTYMTMLLSWTPVGQISEISGVQTRYFIPAFSLLPFILGINHIDGNKKELDSYIIMLSISFLALTAITYACLLY